MKKLLSFVLCFSIILGSTLLLFGCTNSDEGDSLNKSPTFKGKTECLSNGIKSNKISTREITVNEKADYYSFCADLFAETHESGKNTLVSPMSVFFALAMLTNGADGKTLNELENTLGMTKEELNNFAKSYMSTLPQTDTCKMKIANSVWFRDAKYFSVEKNFLQANADYFGADIYKAPFDKSTVDNINSWVNKNTDGMIPSIIDDIPPDTVMYLINALTFDAEWEKKYDEFSIHKGEFKAADGTLQDVEFMYSDESYLLEDDNSIGFIKYYDGRDYAFVTLLPDEDINIDSYIKSLNGSKIRNLMESKKSTSVDAGIPKFKIDFKSELTEILTEMGIKDVFGSSTADLSLLGQSSHGNLFVSSVIHETFIEVNEAGTKAGAVTSIQVEAECAPSASVILNRPFVYMIVDVKNNLPLFIGNVNSLS